MSRGQWKRTQSLVLVFAVPTVSIIVVAATTYWNVSTGIERRRARFDVPRDANADELPSLVYRLHVGSQLEAWELAETRRATEEVLDQLAEQVPVDDNAYLDAWRCQIYYRLLALTRGTETATSQAVVDAGEEMTHRFESLETIELNDLESLFFYLDLLKQYVRDPDAASRQIALIESAIGGKLDTHTAHEAAATFAGLRRRLELVGSTIELVGQSIHGDEINLRDLRGQVVFVEFWSTGCKPCVTELPELKRLYDSYQQKGFEIVGVPTDPYSGTVLAFLDERRITWPQLWGREPNLASMKQWGITSIPSSLLLDRQGRVVALDLRAVSGDPARSLDTHLSRLLDP